MKTIFTFLIMLLVTAAYGGNPSDTISLQIKLNDVAEVVEKIDSVQVVFDKSDRTHPGFINSVCYPANNQVSINVNKGSYFLQVVCFASGQRIVSEYRLAVNSRKTNLRVKYKKISDFPIFSAAQIRRLKNVQKTWLAKQGW
jgi:predicted RNA-binding protein with PIN domain